MQKQKLRESIQNKFLEISKEEKKIFDEKIFKNFRKIFPLETPLKIGSYVSKDNEVSTKALNEFILEKGSSLYLPKVKSPENLKKLKFLKFASHDNLELSDYGVLEPKEKGKPLRPEFLDLIIIPIRVDDCALGSSVAILIIMRASSTRLSICMNPEVACIHIWRRGRFSV